MKTLAIIPGRGGSKGVPGKNIKLLQGKPLIAWTIQAAQRAGGLDRIVVSTDSEQIAGIAEQFGAEVPFLRPPELATDSAPGLAPVVHAAEWLAENQNYLPEAIVMLQPTSPFRPLSLIDEAVNLLEAEQCSMAICLTPAKRHPYWMKTITNGLVQPFFPGINIPTRRQDLPSAFAISGSVYAWTWESLQRRKGNDASGATQFADERVGAVYVEGIYSLDIDTELDFRWAECLAPDLAFEKPPRA